ncbi:MAG: hypothetical protein ACE5NG_18225 [bacterium]
MRTKRIIIGILIGATIGAGLEWVNVLLAFLMPPFFILLPSAVLIGGCIGAVVKGTKDGRLLGKTQDIEYLPACVAEFIKVVIKKMRYRKKVRQDVQTELVAHFEDELKECDTDEEKEQKAEELITEFGDVKLLAILTRRAKKRCRPLWQTVIARTFQAVGVIIALFCVYTVWFITGKPAISVDYLAILNQMGRPQVRDEDNAWPHYEKAIRLYKEPIPGGVVQEFLWLRYKPKQQEEKLRFEDLNEDHQGQILEWLHQNQVHWDNLSTEQKNVILKFFEYNWVPILKKLGRGYPEWGSTFFDSMVEHIIKRR